MPILRSRVTVLDLDALLETSKGPKVVSMSSTPGTRSVSTAAPGLPPLWSGREHQRSRHALSRPIRLLISDARWANYKLPLAMSRSSCENCNRASCWPLRPAAALLPAGEVAALAADVAGAD